MSDTATKGLGRQVMVVLPGLMLAMLLAMLDNLIVGTSMPHIVGELGGASHLSWVVTAYVLATTVSTPLWGKFGDLYGRKNFFMGSIVIFLAGSALSGLSQSMTELIAFRAIQGLGAGGLMVGVMAIVGDLIPPRERGRFQGYMAAMMAVAMVGGPLLGGFLTDHLSWRWSFYINLPLGLITLAVIALKLHLPKHKVEHKIDYVGAGLLAAAAAALVLVATWGGTQYDWVSTPIIGLLIGGLVALGAFVLVERRVAEPILPLHLFKDRNFTTSSVLAFLVGFAMFGAVTFLPFYQQIVQGASATNSGLLLLPMLGSMLVAMLATGRVITKTGHYRWFPVLGGALLTVGALLLSQVAVDTTRTTLSLYMAVFGLGIGFMMSIVQMLPQNSVQAKDMGVASSTSTFFRSIGSSFGVSILGAVFASRLSDGLSGAGAAGKQLAAAGTQMDPSKLNALPGAVRGAYEQAVTHAASGVFGWAILFSAAAFVAALFIKAVPLRGAQAPKPEPRPEPEPELVDAMV
ncbi:MAG TPA: MDR family MFS transporter [Mycobacteriales bacterium]|nr:MDR family MFS transporter [Mycobacteriales bacterium]